MKYLVLLLMILMAANLQAQSYMVLENGIVLTLDRSGFIYDFSHFVMPYKVSINGGQFLVEDSKLITIDENGFLYRKDQKVKAINGKGNNYYIDDDNELVTIDSKGFFYHFGDEDFKRVGHFGGNFFTIQSSKRNPQLDLYTVNSKGNYFKLKIDGLDPLSILHVGGNYFVTKSNVAYTVSRDGFVFAKPQMSIGSIRRRGGNYFINDKNQIFTVSEEGLLLLPDMPDNLKLSSIKFLGANYLVTSDGMTFVIDKLGSIYQRIVPGHEMTKVKFVSF